MYNFNFEKYAFMLVFPSLLMTHKPHEFLSRKYNESNGSSIIVIMKVYIINRPIKFTKTIYSSKTIIFLRVTIAK